MICHALARWLLGPLLACCLLQALPPAMISTRVCAAGETASPRFEITLDPQIASRPIDGRLYLFLSQRGGHPMRGPDWFRPEPFARLDVTNFRPGEARTIDDQAAAFPDVISKLPGGTYRTQAVLDYDFYDPRPADGVGNLYSEVVEITIGQPPAERTDESQPGAKATQDAQASNPGRNSHSLSHELRLTKRIESIPFPESKWVKEVVLKSELLERFHKREMVERAAVVLPASYYDEPLRKYPVVYVIPGFGGSHRDGLRYATMAPSAAEGETQFIRVYLSGRCKWGHHVYADSATNGPRGETLIREMIPLIDREFRTVAESTARFVMGHSSGGWSSLWLQVTYPDTFGGVWSSSPDPVDLRDFQQINLYADPSQNMYRDTHGVPRPIARRGEAPVLWFDSFTKMDDVIGRGGQLRSFEAVFSPLDEDGLPKRLWHRETGQIDPAIAKAWEKYDIGLVLERDWQRLGPLLAGKLHITMGTLDTFYLEGATRLLAERLKQLGSDAQVTMVEGASHSSLLTPAYYTRVRREMSKAYWKVHRK